MVAHTKTSGGSMSLSEADTMRLRAAEAVGALPKDALRAVMDIAEAQPHHHVTQAALQDLEKAKPTVPDLVHPQGGHEVTQK